MTTFIPKTDLEWRDQFVDLFERLVEEAWIDDPDDHKSLIAEVRSVPTRDEIESIVHQIREEAVRAHGNGEGEK